MLQNTKVLVKRRLLEMVIPHQLLHRIAQNFSTLFLNVACHATYEFCQSF